MQVKQLVLPLKCKLTVAMTMLLLGCSPTVKFDFTLEDARTHCLGRTLRCSS